MRNDVKSKEDTVSVRMYNVGFGDCFLITIYRPTKVWRMLVDCGVHTQGQRNSLKVIVPALISDITVDGRAHLDIVVATHHHADHIAGFALDDWENVSVGEVWLPFVEDESDADGRRLRDKQASTAQRLMEIIENATSGLHAEAWPPSLKQAHDFALNSFRNADAADRLLARNGKNFKNRDAVIRYFPVPDERVSRLPIKDTGGTIYVLGPSRDPETLKAMEPPVTAGWMRLDQRPDSTTSMRGESEPLFDPHFTIQSRDMPEHIRNAKGTLSFTSLANYDGIRYAASILESSVNNTSLIFVIEIGGVKLLFPGDAQHGAWKHVLELEENRILLSDVQMYKVGHHGSHNGTPREFVESIWNPGAVAFLPWGLVKRWQEFIPKTELIDSLQTHEHEIICGTGPIRGTSEYLSQTQCLYLEKTFPIAADLSASKNVQP